MIYNWYDYLEMPETTNAVILKVTYKNKTVYNV